MMKKLCTLALSFTAAAALAACSGSLSASFLPEAPSETVSIRSLNGAKEWTDLEVPYDPQRLAVLDMAALDIIDSLGLGDRVVGSAETSIDYLSSYSPDDSDSIANLGTIKSADLVEVAACRPDVIFIGGRLSSVYDELSSIAPVVCLSVDPENGVLSSTEANASAIASLFGLEDQVSSMMDGFRERIRAIQETYEGKTAAVGIYSGSSFSLLGDDGRCSIIGTSLGFSNIGNTSGSATSTHGNEASWETIVNLDPEYLFVLDKNTAVNSTGGDPAVRDAVENGLIRELDVYKNGNIIYLAHPNVWYTAEGGIQALDVMLGDLEQELMQN